MAEDQVPVDPEVIREVTPDERRNGWTPESLTAYLEQRRRQQMIYANRRRERRVAVEHTGSFEPWKW